MALPPTALARTAAFAGRIKVPLYDAPWTIPADGGLSPPFFDPCTRVPVIQQNGAQSSNAAITKYSLYFPIATNLYSSVMTPKFASGANNSYWTRGVDGFMGTVNRYTFGVGDTAWFSGIGIIPNYLNTVLYTAPINQTISGIHDGIGNAPLVREYIYQHNAADYFCLGVVDGGNYHFCLFRPQDNTTLLLANFLTPGGLANNYPLCGMLPRPGGQGSYIYSVRHPGFWEMNSIYDVVDYTAPNYNANKYNLSLDDATLDAIYQGNVPNFRNDQASGQPIGGSGGNIIGVCARGFILIYAGVQRTFDGFTQGACILVMKEDGTQYIELQLCPQTTHTRGYASRTNPDWSIAIDPFGILYLTNGFDNYHAAISYAFDIPWGSPTIAWPQITALNMPCFNPCAAVPIGV